MRAVRRAPVSADRVVGLTWNPGQMTGTPIEVAAAAIVAHGRVLAARRTHPADVAGGWELPGGKLDPGESAEQAVRREVGEELGCVVDYERPLHGRSPIKSGYELTAHVVRLRAGEPVPHEHDAIRWLAAEDLDDVDWLPSDRPFLDELRALLAEGSALDGGNVGGAVRVGATVRRPVGPWTPAVHALLDHLAAAGLDAVPAVLGVDEWGREALTFLPGQVHWDNAPGRPLPDGLVADAGGWLRRFHDAVAGFIHPGPWRTTTGAPAAGQVVCHHDFAPYNVALSSSATGPRVVGVFDWDMAAPGVPVQDLAFAAWNWVPLVEPQPADVAARRLRLLADGYGGGIDAAEIAEAVVPRIQRSVDVIRAGQAAGDPGMLNLGAVGEPDRTAAALAGLVARLPDILARL